MHPENSTRKLILVSGKIGSGKTTFVKALTAQLYSLGYDIAGILSTGNETKESQRTGYFLSDIITGEKRLLCHQESNDQGITTGKYHFVNDSIKWGNAILGEAINHNKQIIVLDEVGPLELIQNKGWRPSLEKLLKDFHGVIILVIRENMVNEFRMQFNVTPEILMTTKSDDSNSGIEKILRVLHGNL